MPNQELEPFTKVITSIRRLLWLCIKSSTYTFITMKLLHNIKEEVTNEFEW